jgi:hypothetical protein
MNIQNQRPLLIMYDILSLTNSTLLTADMILLCTIILVPNSWFPFPFHIRLRVQCHLRPIWPPVLPLNLTYIVIYLPPLPWANLPYYFQHSKYQTHIHFLSLKSFIQGICPGPGFRVIFRNKLIFLRLHTQTPSWSTTNCRLSATSYSIYSQLPFIPGGRLLHPQPEDAPCRGDKGPT